MAPLVAGRRAGPLLAAWEAFRRHGLQGVAGRVWRRYVHGDDRIIVFVVPLDGRPFDPGPDGIAFRPATAEDVAALPSVDPDAAPRIQALLRRGDCWLHVARDGGRLVGYRFATRGYWGHGVLASIIEVGADQVYADGVFVHPDYRGRRIGNRLIAAQNVDLFSLGIRGFIGAVWADNVASLRLQRGSRPVFFVESSRRLFRHRCTVSPTMPPEIQRILDAVPS